MSKDESHNRVSSQGHAFSNKAQLDGHFLFAQPEYEAMLRSVGLQKGWHVLDAGCGVGSFLPLMSELVGENGRVSAIDLAPENIEIVNSRFTEIPLVCDLETRVGSVLELPYEDNTFDAVWNAAVAQYLTDAQLTTMLAELKRVVKPGGVVAIKEILMLLWMYQPMPPLFFTRWYNKWVTENFAYGQQALRNETLPHWLRNNGLINVWSKTTLVERFFPLTPLERDFLEKGMKSIVKIALGNFEWAEEELLVWQKLADIESPDHIFNSPDLYRREGHILVVGRKPE